MLRALRSGDSPDERAYAVPWRVDRADPTHPRLVNATTEPLDFVRVFTLTTTAPPEMELWGQMPPGDELELCLCDVDPRDVVIALAWFRPRDGREYIWRFVL